jgi:hypothetical protein
VPVLSAGPGVTLLLEDGGLSPQTPNVLANIHYSMGAEFQLNPSIEIFGEVGNTYFFSDEADGVTQGKYNDWFLSAQVGLQILLGKSSEKESLKQ